MESPTIFSPRGWLNVKLKKKKGSGDGAVQEGRRLGCTDRDRANERVHHPSSLAPFPAPFYYFTQLIYLTALSKSQPKLQFLPVKRRSCRGFHTHVHKTLHTYLKTKAEKQKHPTTSFCQDSLKAWNVLARKTCNDCIAVLLFVYCLLNAKLIAKSKVKNSIAQLKYIAVIWRDGNT